MANDLIAFVKGMDLCWMERRFDDLSAYLADDMVMVAPDGRHRIEGRDASIESYRDFMSRCEVSRFDAHDHRVTLRGAAAIVEYGWAMAWLEQGMAREAQGREILVLAQRDEAWRVVWRT